MIQSAFRIAYGREATKNKLSLSERFLAEEPQ